MTFTNDTVDPRHADYLGCEILDRLNDELDKTEEGWPLNTNLPSPEEIKYVYDMLEGYSRQFFPIMPYKHLLTTVKEIDEVHGELADVQRRWGDIIHLRAFAIPTQPTQPQTSFGIEEVREVTLLVTVPDLITAGLAIQDPDNFDITLIGRLGDRFYYHNREYEVTTYVPAAWWANTDVPIYYQLKSQLHRASSVDEFGNTP